MAYFNTDNLPSSLPPTKAQAPAPNRVSFWNRGRLVGGGILALVVLGGVGLYANLNRNAADADGDPTLPLMLDYTTAGALRGWGASTGFPALAENVTILSAGLVRLASQDVVLTPQTTTVPAGQPVAFTLTNKSTGPVQFQKGAALFEVIGAFQSPEFYKAATTLQSGESKSYSWDLTSDDGQPVKPGTYTLSVEYLIDGASYSATAPVTVTGVGTASSTALNCSVPATASPAASSATTTVKAATLCAASPSAAKVGDTITLRGSGFNARTNLLMIDGLVAGTLARSADGTTLTARLPATLTKPCKEVCLLGRSTPLTPGTHQLGLGYSSGRVESGPVTTTIPFAVLDPAVVTAIPTQVTPPSPPKPTPMVSGTYTSPVIALDPARKLEQLQLVNPIGSEASFKVEMSTDRTNYQSWFALKLPFGVGANLCTDGINPATGERFGGCTSDSTVSLKDMKEFEAATGVRVRITLKTIDTSNPSFNGFRIRMSTSTKPYVPVLKPLTMQSVKIGDAITVTEANGRFSPTENYILIDDYIAASRVASANGSEIQLKLASPLTCPTINVRACTKELTPGMHRLTVRTKDPLNSLSDGLTSQPIDLTIVATTTSAASTGAMTSTTASSTGTSTSAPSVTTSTDSSTGSAGSASAPVPAPARTPSSSSSSARPTIIAVTPKIGTSDGTITVTGTGLTTASKVTLSQAGQARSTLAVATATTDGSKLTFYAPRVAKTICRVKIWSFCLVRSTTPGLAPGAYDLTVKTGELSSPATKFSLR